ncbi:MAG: aminotransferase class I/II-fold pyridoxal phosphate-dependent enzyme [Candidatus Melainabacteria bacterium]|nr:aminotransferase class I/II-fold pyridoxal phosphate-dependent enzyme [Candidatus Melainabacteria bacterium]
MCASLTHTAPSSTSFASPGISQPTWMESPQGTVVQIQGNTLINMGANNYLGWTHHPRLVKAVQEAAFTWGVGAGAVRPINGTLQPHIALDRAIATFYNAEAALAFQSGFAANLAVIPAVAKAGSIIYSDAWNHPSLFDACHLAVAQASVTHKIYPHSDLNTLKAWLSEKPRHQDALIITNGVFSMDGDLALLPELVQLARRYNAQILVDDAHGTGVMGQHGRGTVDAFHLSHEIDILVGSFSKALGSVGGFVVCSQAICQQMLANAHPYLFSTALPPTVVACNQQTLRLLQEEPEHQAQLWQNTRYFSRKLNEIGFSHQSQSPIQPIYIGEESLALALHERLHQAGVLAPVLVAPTVPQGAARLRLIVTAHHRQAQLDTVLAILEKEARALGILAAKRV